MDLDAETIYPNMEIPKYMEFDADIQDTEVIKTNKEYINIGVNGPPSVIKILYVDKEIKYLDNILLKYYLENNGKYVYIFFERKDVSIFPKRRGNEFVIDIIENKYHKFGRLRIEFI